MPNHVHVILRPTLDLARVIAGIKACTAKDANRVLGRRGKPSGLATTSTAGSVTETKNPESHDTLKKTP
jgi:hypothetical protein